MKYISKREKITKYLNTFVNSYGITAELSTFLDIAVTELFVSKKDIQEILNSFIGCGKIILYKDNLGISFIKTNKLIDNNKE